MTDGEQAFVAALAGATDDDTRDFAEFVVKHRLLPWVASVGTGEEAARRLPPAFVAKLHEVRAEQPRRRERLLRGARAVDATLAAAGIDHLFIKGFHLALLLYGDVCLRHQFDVDVLVRPLDFEPALEALGEAGWVLSDAERLPPIRRRAPDAWHALTLRQPGCAVDLHWALRHRALPRIDEEPVWGRRRSYGIDGARFETLSDADTLAYLILTIGFELRRATLRAKLWLDLERALERVGPGIDWDAFLSAREAEGLLPLFVDVLAVFTNVWGDVREPLALCLARSRCAPSDEAADAGAALALVTRPRMARANRAWFDRLQGRERWWPRLRRSLRASLGA